MPKYQKKPVVIEAWQWTGEKGDLNRAPMWLKEAYSKIWGEPGSIRVYDDPIFMMSYLQIATLEGVHNAMTHDFIIQGVKGEIYPCKPDIFEMTYELLEEVGER